MNSLDTAYFLGIDIGAGLGAKLGLFESIDFPIAEALLSVDEYGPSFETFADALVQRIGEFLDRERIPRSALASIGIACPGILRADGSFQLVQNLSRFSGHNLKAALERRFGVPVGIENDANAGGLAEWSVLRLELLYWVFGGGWGGAWISKEGQVRFPAVDWDGNDASLHYTNEPGYSIPLEKLALKTLFNEVNASWERFERIIAEEYSPAGGVVTGPGGSPETLRAEVILSGPGRLRLFRTLVGDDDFYVRFLDIDEAKFIADPSVAGKLISKLSSMRVEAALNTDRLYGKILATATRTMLRAAAKDGMPPNLPICLGGKPSYALPYFGPSAQRVMGRLGLMNYLRPSVIDERGSNANLVGAAVLAHKVWEAAQ